MAKKKSKQEGPKGIGGWLILPTIGLFIGGTIWALCFLIYGFLLCVGGGFEEAVIFLVSVLMTILIIYSIVLEFKKRKTFPKWAIITLWVSVVATFIFSLLDGDYSNLFGATLAAIIWTWYFRASIRVKNTFVK